MEWIKTDDENKQAKHNPCMLWIWDKDLRIGYCHDGLSYWSGDRWVDDVGHPVAVHPDYFITAYVPLPKAKGRRYP